MTTSRPTKVRVVLVTGLSGAGRTAALKALEDLGYEAVDNLPLSLIRRLLDPRSKAQGGGNAIALSVDTRTRDFAVEAFEQLLQPLFGREDLDVSVIFLDCDDETLRRRYTETRRRHPLAEDRPVMDGIALERELMKPLRQLADLVIDTTSLSTADLKRLINGHFRLEGRAGLTVSMLSFSYRRGLPREADLVFDVRFLANPHYQDALRPLTGLDPAVGDHIAKDPAYAPFMDSVTAMLQLLLPHYQREGKSYLTVAIGCTGGRHRSVFVADTLARRLTTAGRQVVVRHRDLEPNGLN